MVRELGVSRRRVLGFAAFAAAGCTSIGESDESTRTPPNTATVDEDDDYPDNVLKEEELVLVEESLTIDPGEFEYYRLDTEGQDAILEYDLLIPQDDATIDVFLMDRGEFVKYTDRDQTAEYLSTYSGTNLGSAEVRYPLAEGDYMLILDHTDRETDPNPHPVDVDIELELAGGGGEYGE